MVIKRKVSYNMLKFSIIEFQFGGFVLVFDYFCGCRSFSSVPKRHFLSKRLVELKSMGLEAIKNFYGLIFTFCSLLYFLTNKPGASCQ